MNFYPHIPLTPTKSDSPFSVIFQYGPSYHKSRHNIYTSLYKAPHRAEHSNPNQWRSDYVRPLLSAIASSPDCHYHVYLCPTLEYLVPELSGATVYLMRYTSNDSLPGMLWRYLGLSNGGPMTFRGCDNSKLDQSAYRLIKETQAGHSLARVKTYCAPVDSNNRFIYRTCPGSISTNLPAIPNISNILSAWEAAWYNNPQLTTPIYWNGVYYSVLGAHSPTTYGQDELFLCHWLFHKALEHGPLFTLIHPAGSDTSALDRDLQYINSVNPLSKSVIL